MALLGQLCTPKVTPPPPSPMDSGFSALILCLPNLGGPASSPHPQQDEQVAQGNPSRDDPAFPAGKEFIGREESKAGP